MRSRNIKPGFFKNEALGTQDPIIQVVFAGLWCLADKNGRLEDRPLRIKAEILPYRYDADINGYLATLSQLGFIEKYEVGGKPFIQVLNFGTHQNPHHTEKASNIPAKSDSCALTVSSPLKNGEYPADSLIPDSLIPDSPSQTKYGSHVKLTDKQFEGLMEKIGEQVYGYIDRVNDYCAATRPKGYKDYAAAIRNFWRKDGCPVEKKRQKL